MNDLNAGTIALYGDRFIIITDEDNYVYLDNGTQYERDDSNVLPVGGVTITNKNS